MRQALSVFGILLILLPEVNGEIAASTGRKLKYNRDIRPILSDKCFACHGPDKNHREADLRLDVRQAAIDAKAILPGKPADSLAIERILTHDEDDLMPPPEAKKPLTTQEKQILQEWITQGAEYEPHWAYTPLIKPLLPEPQANSIDAFISAAQQEKKLSLSSPALPATILRRMSLDLIGLPPTPSDVIRFETEYRADAKAAVKALAQRLMKSRHFGERWAVWWLDVARFADTVGFHGDQNQRIFPYRDYVIQAFNTNKRFDQFTLEQLAGDLLPNPTTEQLVATGFNRLNMMTREGGAQPKEYLAKYQADRVRTIGGAWLGATLGCCECHDHKFDPYTQHDFYALSAFFGDVKQFGVYSSYGYSPVEELTGWSNDHPFPPEILVDSPYLAERLKKIESQMAALAITAATKAPAGTFETWKEHTQNLLKNKTELWQTPSIQVQASLAVTAPKNAKKTTSTATPKPSTPASSKPAAEPTPKPAAPSTPPPPPPVTTSVLPDGRLVIKAKAATHLEILADPGKTRVAAIRLELLPDAVHQQSIELNGTQKGMTIQPQFFFRKAGTKANQKLNILNADASLKELRYAGTAEIPGIKSGWKTSPKQTRQPHESIWLLAKAQEFAKGDVLVIVLPNNTIGSLRLSYSPLAPLRPLQKDWVTSLRSSLAQSKDKPHDVAAQTWLMQASADLDARNQWTRLQDAATECNQGKAWTQVTVATKEPLVVRRLPRGNWMDESGEICQPAPPEFLTEKAAPNAPRQSRVDLAKWLTSANNPLTSRAFMNRLWKQFFGNGLSLVADDLGAQGETPSHPELLDWLACEFRDSGWDIQHMMEQIVTSSVYLQNSRTRPEYRDLDPSNRFLSFQNPRRLDAEFIRDNALFASGLLNLDLGGPSAHPYQPPSYYENLQFPSREYQADLDDRQWRRGVYMHWQRTFLHPMLANFDAPARDESTCTRNVSNTPQQALTLLNDPSFVEAARVMASRLNPGSDDSRINALYQQALGRQPKPQEKQSLLSFLATQRQFFQANPGDASKFLATGASPVPAGNASELAAWASVCRVILNLHETITRY